MAQKAVAMEAKLLAALSAEAAISGREIARRLGISHETVAKYRRRFKTEGAAGLLERSRRPLRSPQKTDPVTEAEIVRLRKELPLDNGARAIAYHLERQGWPVPSASTIHRVLRAHDLVVPQPQKAPPSKSRRFEYPLANGAWQIDATQWALVDRQTVWVMDILDDHSRLLIAAQACTGPTSAAAWAAFRTGVSRFGLPARVMSDNGTCFTHRLHPGSGEAAFERDLRALGIRHILSSPAHPQTCGKLERHHQTLKKWLTPQPRVATLEDLQTQLDTYQAFYNHQRPHSALDGATPAQAFTAATRDHPGDPIDLPANAGLRTVTPDGKLFWASHKIGIGAHLAGHQLLVIARGLDLTIFGPQGLVRALTIDPTRRYQPSGRPPGRPRRTPH